MIARSEMGIASENTTFSRRDFLRRIRPELFQYQTSGEPLALNLNPSLSRRQFTKLATSAVINLTTSQVQVEGTQAAPSRDSKVANMQQEQADRKPAHWDTMKESSVLGAGLLVGAEILNSLGIPIGNATFKGYEEAGYKKLGENNLTPTLVGKVYGCAGIAIPVFEEAVFRLVPSALLSATGAKGIHWEVGIPATAVFTLSHSISKDVKNGGFKFYKTPCARFTGNIWSLRVEIDA